MPFARKAAAVCAAALTLTLTGLTVNPAAAAPEAAPRPLMIRSVKVPTLVVDMSGGSSAQDTPAVLNLQTGGASQLWEVVPVQGDWFQLRNEASGTCLVNGYHSVDNGHGLSGFPCIAEYEDQLWTRVAVAGTNQFSLVNKYSGKCMDQGALPLPRTQVTQSTCTGQAQQRWTAITVV
ncbi:RICIN domain-containing protein [Streptomyces sp. NPDC101166]|uniref:RICIN domain-containing protein n=1 Tax=Streptomyces sp. NPDC101166 TaxID=3366120 RepID=UPI00381F2CCA